MNQLAAQYLKDFHDKRTNGIRQREARDIDMFIIVTEPPGWTAPTYYASKESWEYEPQRAKRFYAVSHLYRAMEELEGYKYQILKLKPSGTVEDATEEMMKRFAYDHLGYERPAGVLEESPEEEKDMPEDTGSKMTTVGSFSAVGKSRLDTEHAPSPSKAFVERGQMKLFEVDYVFQSSGRYGKGFSFEGKMTFLHRGEETPSDEYMRMDLFLRGEHVRAVTDGMVFGEPKELSFHQVKMSDLSLEQFITIQSALMKGEL